MLTGRTFPWIAVAATAGALADDALTWEPQSWLGLAILLAATVAMLLFPARRRWFLPIAAFGLGFASLQFATATAPPLATLPKRAAIVSGTIRGVEPLPRGLRVLLEHPSLNGQPPLDRTLRIRLRRDDAPALATGDTLRVRAMLRPPAAPAYPGAWDLQHEAYFAGIGGYGYALNPATPLAQSPPDGPARAIQRLRETITARIAAVLPGTEGAIAATLLTGNTAQIPEADRAAFRDSGLAHLLAIAGLHIGIVMAFWFGLVRALLALSEYATLRWPLKQIAAIAALLAGAFYLLLTGVHVPILRSFAMASLVTLGVLAGRRAISLRGLAIAMIAVVLLAPWEVSGVSFQMSFSAVLALIAGYEALRPHLVRLRGEGGPLRRLGHHMATLALTSALAGTASAPFAAYHFGHVQIYYVLANMLAVPITALLVMPAGMLALLLMPAHLEALALQPMRWGIAAVLRIGRTVSNWPDAVIAVPHIPAWGLVIIALALAWLGIVRGRLRLLGFPAMLLGLLTPLLAPPPDILVSGDARWIGLNTGTQLLLARDGGDSFVRDAWLTYLGHTAAGPLPECAGVCALPGKPGASLVAKGATPPCDGSLLLSSAPVRGACKADRVIDRFTVYREGAQSVWLRPAGPLILSDRAMRGDRPWVTPWPTSRETQGADE